MGRSGRIAIDGSGSWQDDDKAYYEANSAAYDTSGNYSDYTSHTLPAAVTIGGVNYTHVTVWGAGLVSLDTSAQPSATELAFFQNSVPSGPSGFPNPYVAFDNLQDSGQTYFIGVQSNGTLDVRFIPQGDVPNLNDDPTRPVPPGSFQLSFTTDGVAIGAQYNYFGQEPAAAGSYSYDINGHTGSGTVNSAQPQVFSYASLQVPACFAAGTMILTTRGEIPIEALRIGDEAVTPGGTRRRVLWTGRRTIDCAAYPRPDEVMPILVRKDAFAPGQPNRDLVLSPGHCIVVTCLEPVLVPVEALTMGAVVRRLAVATVAYWHVEIEGGDPVIANGLATESYADFGNRNAFEGEGALALFPRLDAPATARKSLRQIGGGPIVEAIRLQLAHRARETTDEVARREVEVEPASGGGAVTIRCDTGGEGEVVLSSPSFVPARTGASPDDRRLGVIVRRAVAVGSDGRREEIPLASAIFAAGFYGVERGVDGDFRWTDGAGAIDVLRLAGPPVAAIELEVVAMPASFYAGGDTAEARAA